MKLISYIYDLDPDTLDGFKGEILTLLITFIFCFAVGATVKTRVGNFLYKELEDNILIRIPGFKIIKETINQFAGDNDKLFRKANTEPARNR